MDPVTMAIVNGIACGAASSLVTATVPAAVKAATDAWNSFKALLQRKFGQDSALLKSVQELEQNPDSKARKEVVAEEVAKSKAHQDEELLAAAGKLLELLEESAGGGQTRAKYQVDAQGAQIGVLGDNANVKDGIHFGRRE
jgi:Tfp pilus assembly protein PilN